MHHTQTSTPVRRPVAAVETPRPTPREAGLDLAAPARYRSVLVPVDGGPFGEHALPVAVEIARRAGAAVRVVHVHRRFPPADHPGLIPADPALDAARRRCGLAYLDDLARRLEKATDVAVTPSLLEGDAVADALCDAAGDGADLVVMATHGRGPVGRAWWGSVADALSRRAPVPVLLVRGHDAPADLTGAPAVRHVLIPLDGSAFAERVLEPALALGALHGADHTLLRVARTLPDYAVGYPAGGVLRPLVDRRHAETWGYLRDVTERAGGRKARVRPCLVHDDQPTAAAILRYARDHDVDLIALATHGRHGLDRLVRGSVTDRVVRGASVPVLVYRPADGQDGRTMP